MRIVLDTNILVRCTAASAGGPAWEVLQFAIADPHALLSSPPLLLELADVLQRPKLRQLHRLSDDEIARFVAEIQAAAVIVPLPPSSPLYLPNDPKDNAIVQTAILGQAELICTLDKHLYQADVLTLCKGFNIRVTTDVELLRDLMQAE